MARTEVVHYDDPLAMIPHDLNSMIDQGWKIGSWEQKYDADWKCSIGTNPNFDAFDFDWDQEDEWQAWETIRPRQRPAMFNKLLRAIVQMMVALHNNEHVAFAIDKTKMFLPESEAKKEKTPEAVRFYEAIQEFIKMDFDQQLGWSTKIMRRGPFGKRSRPKQTRRKK